MKPVPAGTEELPLDPLSPQRGFGHFHIRNPPLKRWALIVRPSGTTSQQMPQLLPLRIQIFFVVRIRLHFDRHLLANL